MLDFKDAVTSAVPSGSTFIGVPRHFPTISASRIFRRLIEDEAVKDLLTQQGLTMFVMRVMLTMFPEHLYSVWIIFGGCKKA